ncbi:MAG TPA: hypothetical protein PKC43_09235 [Phycisphaerales bacterium]|nr:hypothetical protein [Phycisphaerales bacterium]HMP37618.1 hypothetical protein [Phycisphaerales bacterium]
MVLLIVHLMATAFMTGVIWFVQIVHYPLFARVGAEGFPAYEAAHQRLTTFVVGPAMLVEALCAAALVAAAPAGVPRWMAWAGLAMVAALWLSTAALQVPAHARLSGGFDAAALAALVGSNWVRTALWSARAVLAGWMVALAAA